MLFVDTCCDNVSYLQCIHIPHMRFEVPLRGNSITCLIPYHLSHSDSSFEFPTPSELFSCSSQANIQFFLQIHCKMGLVIKEYLYHAAADTFVDLWRNVPSIIPWGQWILRWAIQEPSAI